MIDPDYFGCSSKLSYAELRRVNEEVLPKSVGADFSSLNCEGTTVLSIDRVHRCADDLSLFAKIAVGHVLGDILCAPAIPLHALVAFEFGIDLASSGREELSSAVAAQLRARGIELGKCHSSLGGGATAVTIAIVAAKSAQHLREVREGALILSRGLGLFKLQYLREIGTLEDRAIDLSALGEAPSRSFLELPWVAASDVSGHGLAATLLSLAKRYSLDLDVPLSSRCAASPEVLTNPVECLGNPLSDFDGLDLFVEKGAWPLAGLRETAGPLLALLNDEEGLAPLDLIGAVPIGRYRRGSGRVHISWEE